MNLFFQRKYQWMLLIAAAVAAAGCNMTSTDRFAGRTMGTTYHVQVVASRFSRTAYLADRITARLAEVNQSMSTYRPDSEISRFNAMANTDTRLCVSADFQQVMAVAAELYGRTGGAWDGTVAPLVNLWGFGTAPRKDEMPSPAEIARVRQQVGFDRIVRGDDGCLAKTIPSVSLDLASIAKGFGVDAVAKLLQDEGFRDFLVEIGGEVFASGLRPDGRPWQVGINRPDPSAAADQVYRVVGLSGRALATSGDYRNFFVHQGVRYSHLIDPRTGYPVSNRVVSASVLAPNCTLADGLATALTVMGPARGTALVETLTGVECLVVVQDREGRLIDHASKGFR